MVRALPRESGHTRFVNRPPGFDPSAAKPCRIAQALAETGRLGAKDRTKSSNYVNKSSKTYHGRTIDIAGELWYFISKQTAN